MDFQDVAVDRERRFSLGRETTTEQFYLSIPVALRLVDAEEYYLLTPEEFSRFRDDPEAAGRFADRCRQRSEDARLLVAPGPERGVG